MEFQNSGLQFIFVGRGLYQTREYSAGGLSVAIARIILLGSDPNPQALKRWTYALGHLSDPSVFGALWVGSLCLCKQVCMCIRI